MPLIRVNPRNLRKSAILTKNVGLFSFIDIHFIKLTVSKGFDAYSFILSAIRVMP